MVEFVLDIVVEGIGALWYRLRHKGKKRPKAEK